MLRGTFKSRKQDNDGKPIGSSNPNPILDTREYLVCFEDGMEDTYTANLITIAFIHTSTRKVDNSC